MKNGNMWTFFMRKIFWEVKFLKIKKNGTPGDRVILPQVFHLNSEKFGGGEYTHKTNLILGGFITPEISEIINPPKSRDYSL